MVKKPAKTQVPAGRVLNVIIFANMFLLWISWFQMCEVDPYYLSLPSGTWWIGLGLFALGVILFFVSLFQLRGFENTKRLVTNGVFGKIRHPMYLAFILWLVGYPIFLQAKLSLLSAIIWIPNVLIWRYFEEKELLEKFPGYSDYQEKTWF
jgi:protein-S-isoprenylcysteine O-methyltransferase Ste14